MWFGVISLFPDMFDAVKDYGVTGKAIQAGIVKIKCWNPRDFTSDKHRTVDDRPYGGGPGMLMKIQPLRDAIIAAKKEAANTMTNCPPRVILLSPQGRKLDQQGVESLASRDNLILVAGRYEGIDERLIETEIDEEWSVGDYVTSGGELPAMLLIDAISRLIPGTLGHKDSATMDSFANGLLDCPHYTRPDEFASKRVPDVLLSGNHHRIGTWRLKQSLGRTWLKRPDLLEKHCCSDEERQLLNEFIREYKAIEK